MVHDALKKLEKKATEEEIQTAYLVLSSGLKNQLGSDEKSTSLAYFYALDGVSSWVLQTATKGALKGKAEGLTRPLCHQQQIFIITVKNLNTVFAQGLVVFLKIFKSLS
ncbi:hypothetical protein [Bartonella sp. WD16.2]|uniref:hypothetical protein n=1 Tax=Bartonella sp. WD16.2 TaxID=1933904 RepID=UPI00300156F6